MSGVASGTGYLTRGERVGEETTVRLDRIVFKIGRLDESDLILDNPYISRCHAEIIRDQDHYVIQDLDSTSGTFVNDDRIQERRLKDGDRIRFGQGHGIEFVFHSGSYAEQKAKTAETPFQPIRVMVPENARFIHTEMLPPTADLRRETIDRLRALYEFTSELHSVTSQRELTDKLAGFLHRTLGAERCAVLLYDQEHDSLYTASTSPADCEEEVRPSFGIAKKIIEDNVAVISVDASRDERFSSHDSVQLQAIHAVMCAPIGSNTRLLGAAYVDHLTPERAFDEEGLDFLTAVARQAGITLENLYLLDEQRRSIESFIRTLSASIGARDDSTAGHSARVGAHSAGIARTMGLSEADCRLIYYAGLLHDYGKIGTRDDVLLKPAQLTREEYEHVKEHPLHTFRILSKMRFPEDLAAIPMVAAAHHERWDGSGYPHGLKGEEIPLGSRIVAVADAYDAVSEQRVYHDSVEPERAFNEITLRSGSYFDPEVVKAFGE
ncbi:MAG TPA: HD domain-containing phosphohydrolase, partial [Blastocatellia bacterium]|nr:HD domain-containing phosphohydrolase [Blastocatellia bacterium]